MSPEVLIVDEQELFERVEVEPTLHVHVVLTRLHWLVVWVYLESVDFSFVVTGCRRL